MRWATYNRLEAQYDDLENQRALGIMSPDTSSNAFLAHRPHSHQRRPQRQGRSNSNGSIA
jgi:hypothetical protein